MFNLIEWLYLRQKNNKVYYDSLTGCKNRAYYDAVLKKKYIGREANIYFVDIDDLKTVNDTQGHWYGSKLIKDVANELMRVANEAENKVDVVHYGGDEYVMVCMDELFDGLSNINNISFGISHKETNEDLSSAVGKADEDMYKDKQTHKKKSNN